MFGFVCRQKLTPQQLIFRTNCTGLAMTLTLCVLQVTAKLPAAKKGVIAIINIIFIFNDSHPPHMFDQYLR